jgi:predicted metal-dependent enzyme (double-stranded beta helix superfamily)
METRDWLVTNNGQCQACLSASNEEWPSNPYRLYRFLTEVEDILLDIKDDRLRLREIRPLVRRLLTSSYWLQVEYLEPTPEVGWSVLSLYEEPCFPLTVEIVAWLPGQTSLVHNHATWGVVAIISGQEKNTFWRRSGNLSYPDRIQQVGERIFFPGDIISFLPNAIHGIQTLGDELTVTFNIYGKPSSHQRLEFDPVNHTAVRI